MRVLVGLALIIAVLLTGCSAVPLGPADRVRGALVATRLAGTAQVALTSRTAVLGQGVDVSGTGAFDLADQSAELTLKVPMLGGDIRALIANGTVFAQLPDAFALFVPGAKQWVSLNIDRLAQQQFGTSLAQLGIGPNGDPFAQLGYLQAIRDAREIGPENIAGARTTRYAATIDLGQTPAAKDPATKPAVDRLVAQTGTGLLPVDVWIDEQGRFRQVVQTLRAPPQPGVPPTDQTTTVTFTSFGGPKPAPPPPPTDVTDLSTLLPAG